MPAFAAAVSTSILTTVLSGAVALLAAAPAAAAPDKAAMKDATAKCRAQVKERAHFEAMSLLARHRAVKKCVDDTLGSH